LLTASGCGLDEAAAPAGKQAELNAEPEPSNVLRSHQSRVALANGKSFVRKRQLLQNGTIADHFEDGLGNPVSSARVRELQAEATEHVRSTRGAMSRSLFDRTVDAPATEQVDVVGWMSLDRVVLPRGHESAAVARVKQDVREKREGIEAILASYPNSHLDFQDGSPWVQGRLSAEALSALAFSGLFAVLEQDPGEGHPTAENYVPAVGANVLSSQGWDGSGRTVAIMESTQPDSYANLSGISAIANPSGNTAQHIRWTTGIVRSTLSPFGIAPDVNILIANWGGFSGDVRQWAYGQGADAINLSWYWSNGSDSSVRSYDMWHDFLILQPPYSMMVVLAGNEGNNSDPNLQYVMHRLYNGMVVGASADQATDVRTDDTIYVKSSWRNPTTPNGDRELPEIVAPGVEVDAAGIVGWSGTSASTPIITGLVAAMLERNSTLASWPEAQRRSFWRRPTATPMGRPSTSRTPQTIETAWGS
jgi:subtilisin family serine protease